MYRSEYTDDKPPRGNVELQWPNQDLDVQSQHNNPVEIVDNKTAYGDKQYEDVDQETLDHEFDDEDLTDQNFIDSVGYIFENGTPFEKDLKIKQAINYKYSENTLIKELMSYVNSTYIGKTGSHYAKSKVETTEVIIDNGFGYAFCMGNVLKYSQRYGKKNGYNRKDLMKVLHYALMCLHIHDNEAKGDCYINSDKRTG